MSSQQYEVHVAVYDLSHGMARSLSAQFLGPDYQIDAIPHTGVIVYGMEYFFGGGIQCEEPTALRRSLGIAPIQTLSVGRTNVSKHEFDAWCRQKMDSGEFSMESYDLLNHNCNTFSQVALTQGLQLSQGVPQWILDVPRRFLASPMGQIVRPMLDNMQLGRVSGAQTMTSTTTPTTNRTTPPVASSPAANPWAQIPASQIPVSQSPISQTNTASHNSGQTTKVASYEILNAHQKPLLANETKTISMCVEKVVTFASHDAEADDLRQVGTALETGAILPELQLTRVSDFLLRCLQSDQKPTFALMILRVMVLKNAASCQASLRWISQALAPQSDGPTASDEVQLLPASRAMAWMTLSNVVAGASDTLSTSSLPLDPLVEAAVQDISTETQSRVEVRQAAAAFLYNIVLAAKHSNDTELSDRHVSILCASLELLDQESDETVRLRRVLAAGRILWPCQSTTRHEATAQLIRDLGFIDNLQAFVQQYSSTTTMTKSVLLVKEVLAILE